MKITNVVMIIIKNCIRNARHYGIRVGLQWRGGAVCSGDKLKTINILLDNKCVRKTNNKVCNEREY